jgi:hypothetical protein
MPVQGIGEQNIGEQSIAQEAAVLTANLDCDLELQHTPYIFFWHSSNLADSSCSFPQVVGASIPWQRPSKDEVLCL